MPKHLNITVHGNVHGVGFRTATRNQARYMGIKGFVKNRIDGTVYIEAEGENESMALFVQWCRQGPPFSKVEELEVIQGDWKGYSSFDCKF
jgi:acylphosphatase